MAFAFPLRAYMAEHNAHLWAESAILQGLICHVLRAVPAHVELSWWGGEEDRSVLEVESYRMWSSMYVPKEVVEAIAAPLILLRGALCEDQ